jgi:hypothetical protein
MRTSTCLAAIVTTAVAFTLPQVPTQQDALRLLHTDAHGCARVRTDARARFATSIVCDAGQSAQQRLSRRAATLSGIATLCALPLASPAAPPTFAIPSAAAADSPDSTAESLVNFLLAQMKQNDTPTKNNGLKIALQYSSDENPFTKTPERFYGIMNNGAYSLMLGKYKNFKITDREDQGTDTAIVTTSYFASRADIIKAGVKEDYIQEQGDTAFVNMKWIVKNEG